MIATMTKNSTGKTIGFEVKTNGVIILQIELPSHVSDTLIAADTQDRAIQIIKLIELHSAIEELLSIEARMTSKNAHADLSVTKARLREKYETLEFIINNMN